MFPIFVLYVGIGALPLLVLSLFGKFICVEYPGAFEALGTGWSISQKWASPQAMVVVYFLDDASNFSGKTSECAMRLQISSLNKALLFAEVGSVQAMKEA